MRKRLEFLLLIALVAIVGLSPQPSHAQSPLITGRVVDQAGAPVTGARVALDRGASTLTDADGRFALEAAGDAPVTIVVEKALFRTIRLVVQPGTRRLRMVLEIEPVRETLRVVPPLVDATTFDAFGSTRTIVSAAQVDSLAAIDLASALRRTPGVTISRFNPVGSFGGAEGGSVHIRGVGASRPGSEIKTYVDGVPFYMGLWGHPLLDLLPLSGVEQVTVLKGPQPQTFGNAFSAIDLASRRTGGESFGASARASVGSFGTVVEHARLAGRSGAWEFTAAQGFARSDGHRQDADGRLANVSGRLAWRSSERWTFSGSVWHVDNSATDPGENGRPETKTGRYDTSGTLLIAGIGHDLPRARGTLQAYTSRGRGDWFDQPAPDDDTLTRFSLTGVRWREEIAPWTGGSMSAGLSVDRVDGDAEFQRRRPAPDGRFDGAAFTLVAPHLAVDQTIPLPAGWSVSPSAGLRYYAHSEFDREVAPHVGVVVRGAGALAVRASYARGVNYPGQEVAVLSSLIVPLGDSWRQLRAETLDHVEVGIAFAPTSRTTIDAAAFTDRARRRYLFAFPPAVPRPAFLNLGAYTVRGAEVAVAHRLAPRWQVFGGLTLLDATRAIPYAPRASFVLGVTGAAGRFGLAADAQSQSRMHVFGRARTPVAADLARVGAFTVVNVRPSYRVGARGGAELFVSVENLFDRAYAFRPGYPMPGASVQAGITFGTTR